MARAIFSSPSTGEAARFTGDMISPVLISQEQVFPLYPHIPLGKGVDGQDMPLSDPSPKLAHIPVFLPSPKETVVSVSYTGLKASPTSKGKMIASSTPLQSYASPPILRLLTG